jgi:lipopolysaccharide/colanic/teichoic acid biosynthesis glycosyltransferase
MKLKRVFDMVFAGFGLVLALPLLVLLGALVRFKLGRPVFFRQIRTGVGGRTFEMIKFRSMRNAFDAHGKPLPDEQRMTRFGRFLRSTSLDELPELINVLKGEMSLVGPRPLLPEYLPLYSEDQMRRHEVLPGITGWAQINGRNAISWKKKFELDCWYVDNRSFWLDFKIICLTLWKVLRKSDINHAGHATVEPFNGSN